MELIIFIVACVIAVAIASAAARASQKKHIELAAQGVMAALPGKYLTQPCSRCHEAEMVLLSASPNGRSIHYKCGHCGKKMHAPATSPEAFEAAAGLRSFEEAVAKFNKRHPKHELEVAISFNTPEAPLPFEQTTREPITEAVRTEVWRRDGGACVACGSNQNLEFDHIIPVSKGGATSARNLQLLCKPCNRTKSAKI